jgi:hypothetical protein
LYIPFDNGLFFFCSGRIQHVAQAAIILGWMHGCCAFQSTLPSVSRLDSRVNPQILKLQASSGNLLDWAKERSVQTSLELGTFNGLRGMRTKKPIKVGGIHMDRWIVTELCQKSRHFSLEDWGRIHRHN